MTATAALVMWVTFLSCYLADGLRQQLRFDGRRGEFRILQVADMHYADGKNTSCLDVFSIQMKYCSDLNTSAFIRRLIRNEKPDLIVFTDFQTRQPPFDDSLQPDFRVEVENSGWCPGSLRCNGLLGNNIPVAVLWFGHCITGARFSPVYDEP